MAKHNRVALTLAAVATIAAWVLTVRIANRMSMTMPRNSPPSIGAMGN